MNIWFSCLIIAVSSLGGVGFMLGARKLAPAGSFVKDSDRSSSVFGFLGTAFAVLLAFVIFLATETYTNAKAEAGHEADALQEQYEIAGLLQSDDRDLVRSQLICYGRAVIGDEWRQMRDASQSQRVDDWSLSIEHSITRAQTPDSRSQGGQMRLIEENTLREDGRSGRLREAEGSVPWPMWLMLILGSGCVIGYMLLYADKDELAVVQGAQIGVVVAMIVTSLLLIDFLDHPYRNATASIQPASMHRALTTLEREAGSSLFFPCDATGRPQ